MLFPHYARLPNLARNQTDVALSLEASGRIADGLAIRHALMHVGGLMRSQATVAIGNLVGVTMTNLAARSTRSDKAVYLTPRERSKAYGRYLASIGRPGEAAFADAQIEAGSKVRAVFKSSGNWDGLAPLIGFIRVWVLALALLAGAAFTLLSGVIAAVLARLGWADEDRTIGLGERVLAVLASAMVVLIPAVWLALRLTDPTRWVQGMFNPETSIGPVWPYSLLALLAVPIALKLALIAVALVHRKPLTQAVVPGLQRYAVPLAAVMVLCYGVVLVDLAHRDRALATEVTARVQDEGRYIAHHAGVVWPD
jgi:hypothetical protein